MVQDRTSRMWQRYYVDDPKTKSVTDCRNHGASHRGYGWCPQYDPRWSDEQIKAYWDGYYPNLF